MREHSTGFVAVAALSLVASAVTARAQNFQSGSAATIRSGHVQLTASPVHMFGRDGRPDRTGGAFRLGYGISESFDVEAKSAFFDGVTLVGGDGHFRVFDDQDTSLSLRVGGHQALMSSAPDSTALDLGVELSEWLNRRLELYGGAAFSWESVNGPSGSDFTRFHLVPGIRFGVAERLDLTVEAGIGLNDNSPHFLMAGLALSMPASASARGRER
jgi:hypothetical protein